MAAEVVLKITIMHRLSIDLPGGAVAPVPEIADAAVPVEADPTVDPLPAGRGVVRGLLPAAGEGRDRGAEALVGRAADLHPEEEAVAEEEDEALLPVI